MPVRVGGIEFTIRVVTGDSVKALKRVRAALSKVISESEEAAAQNEKLAQSVTTAASAISAFVAAIGTLRLLRFAKDATLLAARVQNLATVVNNVGRIAGFSAAQIRVLENRTKALGLTTQVTRQSLAQLAQANLDLRKSAQIARIAQDAAVIAGVDSSEAFNRLVVSIQRNDVRLLRNLGIVINLNTVYQKFTQQTGRTIQSLNAFEKRQLLFNEVVRRGELIAGTYEAALQDVGKQITSLPRLVEEATIALGDEFLPVLEKVVKELTKFLKAFPKKEAFITPRQVASLTAGATAATAFAAALAAAALAFKLFGAGALAATGLIGGLILGVGVIVAQVTNMVLKVRGAKVDFEKLGDAAEEAGQKIFEAQQVIGELRDLRGIEINAEQAERFDKGVRELILIFPEFRRELEKIGKTRNFFVLENFFRNNLPRSIDVTSESLAKFDKDIQAQQKRLQEALIETIRIRELGGKAAAEEFDSQLVLAAITEDFIEDTDLGRKAIAARSSAQKEANKLLAQGAEVFVRQNRVLLETNFRLKALAVNVVKASRAAIAFRQARLADEFQTLKKEIKALDDAARDAIQISKRIDTARRRSFRNTSAAVVGTFLDEQDRIKLSAVKTDVELQRIVTLRQESATVEATLQRTRDISRAKASLSNEKDLKARLLQIEDQFAKSIRRIATETQGILEKGRAAREAILGAETKSRRNLTEQIMRQERALKTLAAVTELTIRGVSPRLIELREQLAKATERAQRAERSLGDEIGRVFADISKREAELLGEAGGDSVIARALGVTDPQLKILRSRLDLVINQQGLALKTLALQRKGLTAKFDREADKQTKQLEEREKKLLARIKKIQAIGLRDIEDRSLEGLARTVRRTRKQGEDVAKFITQLQSRLREKGISKALEIDVDVFSKGLKLLQRSTREEALPGFVALRAEALRLEEQFKKTNSAAQVKTLQRAFAITLRQRVIAVRQEIKGLQQDLKQFRQIDRPVKEREQRIARQARFNQLIDAGVSKFKAQREVQRLELADRKLLDAQEKKISDTISQRQRAQKQQAAEIKRIQAEFAAAAAAQLVAIKQQNEAQRELIRLKKEELAVIKQQAAVLAKQRVVTTATAKGGIRGAPGQIPAAPTGTSAITLAADVALKGIGRETGRIIEAGAGTTKQIERFFTQTNESLRRVRIAADLQESRLADIVTKKIAEQRKKADQQQVKTLNQKVGNR